MANSKKNSQTTYFFNAEKQKISIVFICVSERSSGKAGMFLKSNVGRDRVVGF